MAAYVLDHGASDREQANFKCGKTSKGKLCFITDNGDCYVISKLGKDHKTLYLACSKCKASRSIVRQDGTEWSTGMLGSVKGHKEDCESSVQREDKKQIKNSLLALAQGDNGGAKFKEAFTEITNKVLLVRL